MHLRASIAPLQALKISRNISIQGRNNITFIALHLLRSKPDLNNAPGCIYSPLQVRFNMSKTYKNYDGKIAGLYDLEETLGKGHFAVVKLARHVFTGEKVAVKVIDKSKLDDLSRAHLFQEVRCMKLVQHPNVVRLYEVIDTHTKLYLILELGDGGDLYDYIMRYEGGLTEEVARTYFRQIVKAISYCHRLHVVHRDLKPENVVFFEKSGTVKLTDFGFSNRFSPGQKLETSCGSLAYSAPEILLGDSYDAPAVDVWSLGVILYMLVCGQLPFQEANDSETLTMIMDCKYSIPKHVSEQCKKLISKMLIREPDKRASLDEIEKDDWLSIAQNNDCTEDIPLVSREQVSEEHHNCIITKMVNGNIATKEEIIEALDKNEYNHVTATYFLLAERKLKTHCQELSTNEHTETSRANLRVSQMPDMSQPFLRDHVCPTNFIQCWGSCCHIQSENSVCRSQPPRQIKNAWITICKVLMLDYVNVVS
ncbi:SNF-related serine/threonine-protein kinase isoform X3 [Nasonia vitripennis]|uniref:SNF-related serine/threonine-protein kinase n=2 Tax=Nasonia vitripennis TaxID=7425 RepID=A0A7M7Q9L4_NASVI|nr:SNF-related serine/threonine-protein kinase isoform X3 [Nasonia vitripennis]